MSHIALRPTILSVCLSVRPIWACRLQACVVLVCRLTRGIWLAKLYRLKGQDHQTINLFHLFQGPESRCSDESSTAIVTSPELLVLHMLMSMNFLNLALCRNTRGHKYKFSSTKLLLVCVQIFSVNVLSTSVSPCLMMSVSTPFIGLDVVSCVFV